MEGDPAAVCVHNRRTQFQSTPSAWRETHWQTGQSITRQISIHSLRMEGDQHNRYRIISGKHFNPLPPHGGRPFPSSARSCIWYFNPLPPHGGRRVSLALVSGSIHFNPLPPHGGRPSRCCSSRELAYFNPLPPHGGRLVWITQIHRSTGISIHSLRMEGDGVQHTGFSGRCISIHSLRMEGDSGFSRYTSAALEFQSTPSAWRETQFDTRSAYFHHISIHSLRMEGDAARRPHFPAPVYFNPLPPHGGRQSSSGKVYGISGFQSTPSAWRETFRIVRNHPRQLFQSTPSAWRETDVRIVAGIVFRISIHSLRMEGDIFQQRPMCAAPSISIHSLRMEGDRNIKKCLRRHIISIHSLRMEGDGNGNALV